MGNTYSSELLPRIYAGAQQVLREKCPILGLVSREDAWMLNSLASGQRGQQIVIQRPQPFGVAGDFSPSMTPGTPSAMNLSGATVTLNNWKKQDFYITADEALNYLQNNIVPNQMTEAIRSVANAVNKTLVDSYTQISGICGTAGTGVFASNLNLLATAAKVLDDQNCPEEGRNFVMTTKDKESYLNLSTIQGANTNGTVEDIRMGRLGMRGGFALDWASYLPKHTTGSGIAVSLTVAADAAKGALTVSVTDGGTGSVFAAGDVITFSGNTALQYTLAGATTIGSGATATITLNRPLEVAVATAETVAKVTASGTAYQCIAGNMRGFGVAFRDPVSALQAIGGSVIGEHFSGIDPVTGAVLTISQIPGDMMTAFRAMVYYGAGVVQPSYLTRVATVATL